MDITESAMQAAVAAATKYVAIEIGLPYGARSSDYDDLESLKAADAECEAKNAKLIRGLVETVVAELQRAS